MKSPKKPLLRSKEEGQILGLPQEDKKSEQDRDIEDEPSIYFYEDDEEELENVVNKCMPILKHISKQIDSFITYNGTKEFQAENNYHHTYIMSEKENDPRSSIGVKKPSKRQNMTKKSTDSSNFTSRPYRTYDNCDNYDLNSLTQTVVTMLGVKRYEDWILNLNIGNVMHLSPLGLQEMNLQLDNSHELTRDAILEKVVLLSIAYFCVGTELRFLSQNKKNKHDFKQLSESYQKYSKTESEKWQAMAVETACTFLPSECPLVGHVISSYQKHHSIINQPILEDQELNEQLTFVRPLNQVKQDSINYHQIIK